MIKGVLVRPEHSLKVKSLPDPEHHRPLLRGEAENITVPDSLNWYK